MAKFRIALSADFMKPDGRPAYPMFDLSSLRDNPDIDMQFVAPVNDVMPGEALESFDALILLAPRFDRSSIASGSRLSVVARFGVGYDTVDVPACTDAGTALCITPDGVRRPVAVSIITLILALTGKLFIKDALTRQAAAGYARRAEHMGMGLVARTLGSLGIGNIGAELFRLARAFDMEFIAHDPYGDRQLAEELGIELVGLDDLFRRADIVSVNCPLNEETRHIVNAERLALMKPTAYLINTARGPIVDQEALTQVLAARCIAGAGLDVLETEPPADDDPILKLDNVIFSPHALCWTDQCFAGNGAADVKAVLDIMHGREPHGIVNREVVAQPAFKSKLEAYRNSYGT